MQKENKPEKRKPEHDEEDSGYDYKKLMNEELLKRISEKADKKDEDLMKVLKGIIKEEDPFGSGKKKRDKSE